MKNPELIDYQDIESWELKAACRGTSNLFFRQRGEKVKQREEREEKAKKICANCPVVKLCLNYALVNPEEGIWGGKNEDEREKLGGKVPAASLPRHRPAEV